MIMDRILFGDNQFFAINHLSDEKSRSQAMKFRDLRAVTDVLDYVNENGINTFMCTTHERVADLVDYVRRNESRYKSFNFFPGMPYAHKYANAVTELGAIGAVRQYLPGNAFTTLTKGGIALARKDYLSVMELLVDAEMKMFRGVNTPVVFLQNVLTDLLLGLGMKDLLVAFHDYIQTKYHSIPGFITMNLPMLYEVLKDCGIKNPVMCASINKIGFRMPGGREAYEKILRKGDFTAVAMQVFAGGAIPPKEALEYVCGLNGVHSIVFGASSTDHIHQTKKMIETFSKRDTSRPVPTSTTPILS